MRVGIAILLGLLVIPRTGQAARPAKTPAPRYGIAADLNAYPQSTAKEALASVLKAIDTKRFDYLVAQLADPTFVDDRVKRVYSGRFAEQVEDTRISLSSLAVKQLRRFLKDGAWTVGKDQTLVRLKDLPRRCVRLRLRDGRWYLEHPSAPPKPAPKKTED